MNVMIFPGYQLIEMGWLLRDIRKIKNIVSDRVSIVGVVTEGHQKNEEYC